METSIYIVGSKKKVVKTYWDSVFILSESSIMDLAIPVVQSNQECDEQGEEQDRRDI